MRTSRPVMSCALARLDGTAKCLIVFVEERL
jgi:hypothetical protein